MPTPTERLLAAQQLDRCRVCAWLNSLSDEDRAAWTEAISDPRFSHSSVAAEIRTEQRTTKFRGKEVGKESVEYHRKSNHE